jgi:hypothetical protein
MLAWYERRGSLVSVDGNQPQADVTMAVEALLARFVTAVRHPVSGSAQPIARL